MQTRYMLLLGPNDSLIRGRMWERIVDSMKDTMREDYQHMPNPPFNVERFLRLLDGARAQNKWSTMKTKYVSERNRVGDTGIGGPHPEVNWPHYDIMGEYSGMTRPFILVLSPSRWMRVSLEEFSGWWVTLKITTRVMSSRSRKQSHCQHCQRLLFLLNRHQHPLILVAQFLELALIVVMSL
ncbi:hypothetical protein BDB00DRAFT_849178, partial [Zychaea mexicana]|uniref:uncharacterized protein n=1 Tax=Zychaea mexicana TaxID=64656 RepID=UPI0022FE6F44